MKEKPSLSVVIPVYRGESTLEPLVNDLIKLLPKITTKFEIILVNDDSPDGSWSIITRLADQHKAVRGLRLMRNYGQHNATLCGVREAVYPICVTMDDDLQHPPTEIPRLLEKLAQGYDVIYGTPIKQPQGILRNLLTSLTRRTLSFVMGIPALRDFSAFRCFRTDLREKLLRVFKVQPSPWTCYFPGLPLASLPFRLIFNLPRKKDPITPTVGSSVTRSWCSQATAPLHCDSRASWASL